MSSTTENESLITTIRIFPNQFDDRPYKYFFSVDLFGARDLFLARLGTYSTEAEAAAAAYEISRKTGSSVIRVRD
jgi:hypothetical protein